MHEKTVSTKPTMIMSAIKSVAKFIVFAVVGIVAIVVGSFMIRGTMHLWDRQKKSDDDKK